MDEFANQCQSTLSEEVITFLNDTFSTFIISLDIYAIIFIYNHSLENNKMISIRFDAFPHFFISSE